MTSSSRSLKESTWDNSRHPGMACFPGSGHGKSQSHQDKVTTGNVPFLCGNAVSAVMRYVKDLVVTKEYLAGQLAVRKRPDSCALAFSFSLRIFMFLSRPLAKGEKRINHG